MTADTPLVIKSKRQQLIEHRLQQDLAVWVAAGRRDGRSWRVLARQVRTLTGIGITHQTLFAWFGGERR
jgi:hypothetical protein